jgi:hypothetical protein
MREWPRLYPSSFHDLGAECCTAYKEENCWSSFDQDIGEQLSILPHPVWEKLASIPVERFACQPVRCNHRY